MSLGIFIPAGLCEIGSEYMIWFTLKEGKAWWVGALGGINLDGLYPCGVKDWAKWYPFEAKGRFRFLLFVFLKRLDQWGRRLMLCEQPVTMACCY